MADNSYNKLWKSEFDNIVSKKDDVQCSSNNQINLQVHGSYKNDEKNNKFQSC